MPEFKIKTHCDVTTFVADIFNTKVDISLLVCFNIECKDFHSVGTPSSMVLMCESLQVYLYYREKFMWCLKKQTINKTPAI